MTEASDAAVRAFSQYASGPAAAAIGGVAERALSAIQTTITGPLHRLLPHGLQRPLEAAAPALANAVDWALTQPPDDAAIERALTDGLAVARPALREAVHEAASALLQMLDFVEVPADVAAAWVCVGRGGPAAGAAGVGAKGDRGSDTALPMGDSGKALRGLTASQGWPDAPTPTHTRSAKPKAHCPTEQSISQWNPMPQAALLLNDVASDNARIGVPSGGGGGLGRGRLPGPLSYRAVIASRHCVPFRWWASGAATGPSVTFHRICD